MTPFFKSKISLMIAAFALPLLMTSTAAFSQASLSIQKADGDSVRVIGQLPRGMTVRGNRLNLPRGYRLQGFSKKSGQFKPPLGLSASGGGTAGGSGTFECDGCCDVAVQGTPPKLYCSKTGDCGCKTIITIK
ncbi:hypothetical protein [Hoeflea sp. TYP-13]|uniref:hypothetical protein n=1 Tax=Hoeflea sp. TYP-13 TaxID=3230023 RepID=UPI0034C611CE